jgi:5-(carboxyamino)imidazole ribonucleotide synthase
MNTDPTAVASETPTVGIIGGGQLAWMTAMAAEHLGVDIIVQTPTATDPAVGTPWLGKLQPTPAILAPIADANATAQLAQHCQVITFENEFVDIPALQKLAAQGACFRPSLEVLNALLDKYEQHVFLESIGLAVPPFATIDPTDDPLAMGFTYPIVLKSRRYGYDGQGTFIIQDAVQLAQFWQRFINQSNISSCFLIEAFVPFERELAIMVARSTTGEIALHPVVETYQKQQVCRWVIAPALLSESVKIQIQTLATKLVESLGVVGIVGIELFLTPKGQVFINEIAPRTHNSGHLTIDACHTSQFEQHLRAVCGLPLSNQALQVPGAVMVNLLGYESATTDYGQQRQRLAEIPNATVYWYGKSAAKPGRKLGHVTVLLPTTAREEAIKVAEQVEALWYPQHPH